MKLIDMSGQRFGRLLVLKKNGSCSTGAKWLCLCDCGKECTHIRGNLLRGGTVSCGCYALERSTTHGMSGTRLYVNWVQMMKRCKNTKSSKYKNYGARGIKVCDRWLDFSNFYADMGEPPTPKHTLDRINNDGDYEPLNCQWSESITQMNNRTVSRHLTFMGVSRTQAQWSRICETSQQEIYQKLKDGKPLAFALGLHTDNFS